MPRRTLSPEVKSFSRAYSPGTLETGLSLSRPVDPSVGLDEAFTPLNYSSLIGIAS
jgi:hypothetical protein